MGNADREHGEGKRVGKRITLRHWDMSVRGRRYVTDMKRRTHRCKQEEAKGVDANRQGQGGKAHRRKRGVVQERERTCTDVCGGCGVAAAAGAVSSCVSAPNRPDGRAACSARP